MTKHLKKAKGFINVGIAINFIKHLVKPECFFILAKLFYKTAWIFREVLYIEYKH